MYQASETFTNLPTQLIQLIMLKGYALPKPPFLLLYLFLLVEGETKRFDSSPPPPPPGCFRCSFRCSEGLDVIRIFQKEHGVNVNHSSFKCQCWTFPIKRLDTNFPSGLFGCSERKRKALCALLDAFRFFVRRVLNDG